MLQDGRPDEAQASFADVLVADPGSDCAPEGLADVRRSERREAAHCGAGDTMKEAGDEEGARRAYEQAVHEDARSACGTAGLAALDGDGVSPGDVVDFMPRLGEAITACLLVLAGGLALWGIGIVGLTWWRGRKASLVLRPFGDGAQEPAVGAAVTALVEHRLTEIGRRAELNDLGPSLDLIVADVELLDADDDLGEAFAGIAAIPNMELMAGLAALLARVGERKRRIVIGDVLPPGPDGAGLTLAVRSRGRSVSRETLWAATLGGAEDPSSVPAAYYRLAQPAASWVQYAVACDLRPEVQVITGDAESFALYGAALRDHRGLRLHAAMALYRGALELDGDNVGALVNLARLSAWLEDDVEGALRHLEHARAVLEQRHAAMGRA